MPTKRSGEVIVLGAILLLALAIRLQGINFGLPAQIHPDEPVLFLTARELNTTGGINQAENPIGYSYPPLFVRLLQYEQKVIRLVGGEEAAQATYFLWGRATSVLFSVLTVLFGTLLARRFVGATGSFLAAIFLAVNPLLSEHARFMTVDSAVTFLIVLTIFLSFLAMGRGTKWSFGALAAGLAAVATKYSALPVLGMPLVSQIVPNIGRKRRVIGLLVGSLAAVGATLFVLITRYHMLESVTVPYAVTGTIFEKENPIALISFGDNVRALYESLGGLVPMLTLLAGAIIAWSRKTIRTPFLILSGLLVVYLLLLSPLPFSGDRHLVPLVTIAGILWAIGIAVILDHSLAKLPTIGALLMLLVFIPALRDSAQLGAFLREKDTRLETVEWFAAHAEPESRIIVEYDAVEFERDYGGYVGPSFSVRVIDAIPALSKTELQEADYLVSDSRAWDGFIASGAHPDGLIEEARIASDGRPGPARIILRVPH